MNRHFVQSPNAAGVAKLSGLWAIYRKNQAIVNAEFSTIASNTCNSLAIVAFLLFCCFEKSAVVDLTG